HSYTEYDLFVLLLFTIPLPTRSSLFPYTTLFRSRTELGLTHTPWAFRFFPTELPLFLLGILSYKLYKSEHIKLLNQKVNLAILVFVIIAITMYDKIAFSFKPQIFFVMFFMAIPFIFELSKKSKIDRYVGELSYPLYLIHLFVIVIVSHLNVVIINKGITVLVISLVGSIGLKHLVSDRVESYRQNRLQKN